MYMKDLVDKYLVLQNRINNLELENKLLKSILTEAGIDYSDKLKVISNQLSDDDTDQGKRIIHPEMVSEKMANLFYSWFWGRQNVYAKRSVNKDGRVSYFPQCTNFWKDCCPKKYGNKVNCSDCKDKSYKQLTIHDILDHLNGKSVIGVYPLLKTDECRFLVFDFDNHEKGSEQNDFANKDDEWIEEVNALVSICRLNGIDALVERSRSGKGAHIWVFFDKPIPASLARSFGSALLDKGAEQVNMKSFKYYDRMLPAQDCLPKNGIGNLIALPLQKEALLKGNSAFIDENWNAYPDQWNALFSKTKLTKEFVESMIKEWIGPVHGAEGSKNSKPWNKSKFRKDDVDGKLNITLADGIYIDNSNIKVNTQNAIRRLAAFLNPVFYRNQAIGLLNYDKSRWIYLGQDHPEGYIQIPIGLYDILIENINQADICYEVEDKRQTGRSIDICFNGELKDEQISAVNTMCKYDNGILHAATAFGKTVVATAMIAKKKVNTLIILESSSLIEQWINSLERFLTINEQLPTYRTQTGRLKTRKSHIGLIQASHDSASGIIDIAMAGSLCKKGEFHKLLDQYGMIIVDECHHVASDTLSAVLRNVKAKYIYGVTATPKRSDGLEKINYMLLGPIRYSYSTKQKALKQGIKHLVYPRFTPAISLKFNNKNNMHPNDAYEILRNNEIRDQLIIEDIRNCIANKRTPIILSKYKDHTNRLYECLKGDVDHAFLLTGDNSKKEHKQILEKMNQVKDNETLAIFATGKLAGEGFDYPRLDTLIMAMPVSFQSVVEQYAGRLNRDYPGKTDVIVYDYVDSNISMFSNMYSKRLKAYKQIGYEVYAEKVDDFISNNNIFDGDNYLETFTDDLLKANKSIVISSPAISGTKINELINLTKEKMLNGVTVSVITNEPDSYGFGDPVYWMKLHREMIEAGIHLKTIEDCFNYFAVIDEQLVWYGNMNLLSKTKIEDSMMRIDDKIIASNLMNLYLL